MTSRPFSRSSPCMRMAVACSLSLAGLHSINLVKSPVDTVKSARNDTLTPAMPPELRSRVPAKMVTEIISTIHKL